jgi:DNA-binding NtrC family response regulator
MYQRLAEPWQLVLIDADLLHDHPQLLETATQQAQRAALFMREPDLARTAAAIRAGACDVLNLPIDVERVRRLIASTPAIVPAADNPVLRSPSFEWIGKSPANLEAFLLASRAATTNASVLIIGEAGVGKEFLARIIHDQSTRAQGPFINVNCAAADDTTLAIELFGGQSGLNGQEPVSGQLARAAAGTLFLDEVSQLSLALQGRLAAALRERHYSSIGTFERQTLHARIIAAANRDLEGKDAQFRHDLLYEFAVKIVVPPLRRRGEDIPLLATYFLHRFAQRHQKSIHGFTRDALGLMEKYDWPGNVRQLRNVVERAVISASGTTIDAPDLAADLSSPDEQLTESDPASLALDAFERRHIRRVWRLTGGHLGQTADLLGVHRNTLRRKLEQYGITEEDART